MTREEFFEQVVLRLREYYGNDAEVLLNPVQKLNNKILTAVIIKLKEVGDSNVSPVIYLEQFWEKYVKEDVLLEDIVGEIIDIRSKDTRNMDELARTINNYEEIKGKIYPMLISCDGNEELLERYAFSKFLDMAVLYFIRLEDFGDGCGTVKITNDLMDHYRVSISELHEQALRNMQDDGYCMKNMATVIRELFAGEFAFEYEVFDEMTAKEPEMYLVTNDRKMYGAAAMLNDEMMKDLVGDKDYYILPSALHEIILVPTTSVSSPDVLADMVREVNDTQVSAEDRLTYSVYKWQDGKVSIAA